VSLTRNSSENPIAGSPFVDRSNNSRTDSKYPAGRIVGGVISRVNIPRGVCSVWAERNYYTNVALPNLESDAAGPGGTITGFRQGQPVRLLIGKGMVQILSLMPVSTNRDQDSKPHFQVNDEIETVFTGEDGDVSFTAGPRDVVQGDWARLGNQGQSVSLVEGGVARLKATPMSQICCSSHGDTTKINGRTLKMFTGFGETTYGSDGGRNYLEVEGSPYQLLQSSRGTDNKNLWMYQYLVGSKKADGFVDTRISDLTGNRVYSNSIDISGNQTVTGKGNYTRRFEGTTNTSVRGNRRTQLDTGDDLLYLEQGKRVEHYAGGQTTEIMESKYCRVGGQRRDRTVGDWSVSARNMAFNISGDAVLGNPISNSLDFVVSNGSVNFDVGNPLSGDLLKSLSGFHVNQYGPGAIELIAKDLGQIYIDTTIPVGTIMVGGNIFSPAIEPAVLGLKFITLILSMMANFDTHFHPLPFPFPPTLPTPLLMTPTIGANVPFTVSKKVLIGQ